MAAEVMGKNLYVVGWALKGTLPPEKMAVVLQGAVARLGMSTNGMKPTIHQYPLNGKGGVGHTVYLPFAEDDCRIGWWRRIRIRLARLILWRQPFASLIFQPLTESFIVSDDYPELGRTYVILASCLRPYNLQTVTRYLARQVGTVMHVGRMEL